MCSCTSCFYGYIALLWKQYIMFILMTQLDPSCQCQCPAILAVSFVILGGTVNLNILLKVYDWCILNASTI